MVLYLAIPPSISIHGTGTKTHFQNKATAADTKALPKWTLELTGGGQKGC